MSRPPTTPNPRLAIALLMVIMGVQAFYASNEIFGDGLDTGDPLGLLIAIGFAAYVGLIVAFAVAAWRQSNRAWPLGVIVAATGLVLAGLQIVAGDPAGSHAFGMVIDGAILFYLFRPSIRALFDA
jgi:hypothetical protein